MQSDSLSLSEDDDAEDGEDEGADQGWWWWWLCGQRRGQSHPVDDGDGGGLDVASDIRLLAVLLE